MEQLREWLPQHLPDDAQASIVHGDYRLGNVLVDPQLPQIAVVLDWELCTLGHPLADLGYVCQMYHQPSAQGGCLDVDLAAEGILPQQDFIAAYCRAAGREPPASMNVFIVFSMFRLAAIQAGVYRRALDGNAADARALQRGASFKALAEQAWALAQRAG
jgi:aminoglycoside phosphotransferase (APT) family kinase protein